MNAIAPLWSKTSPAMDSCYQLHLKKKKLPFQDQFIGHDLYVYIISQYRY